MTRRDPQLRAALRCPACAGALDGETSELRCRGVDCGARYPVLDGIPVLIDDARSVFRVEAVEAAHREQGLARGGVPAGFEARVLGALPRLIDLERIRPVLERFAEELAGATSTRVLVVGGGMRAVGLDQLERLPGLVLIPVDVYASEETLVVCDGHDLPFADAHFDAVLVQSVLEHVADPPRVVAEIRRVLRPRGVVLADTPFLYPVHEGRFDFTRYTRRGHRRLFREFDEIASGALHGPGTSLAVSWRYFLRSFGRSRRSRGLLVALASVSAFWLKYLDGLLLRRPGGEDAAAGFYFLGRRAELPVSDADIVALYPDSRDGADG